MSIFENKIHTKKNLPYGIYVCIIYPAFVASWFPRSVYALNALCIINVLTCMIYNCIHSTEDDWSYLCLP